MTFDALKLLLELQRARLTFRFIGWVDKARSSLAQAFCEHVDSQLRKMISGETLIVSKKVR